MRVLILNGSPHKNGATFTALSEIGRTLVEEGIEYQIIWLGKAPVISCTGCYSCKKTGKCFYDDIVNEIASQLDDFDAIIIGSPVHYAGSSGMLTAVLGRLFMSAGKKLEYKPGAAIVNARRSGCSEAIGEIEKFFAFNSMPLIRGRYIASTHGSDSNQTECDLEGMQTMRSVAHNLAWIMKCIESGKNNGIERPQAEEKIKTDFIRDKT